MIFFGKSTMEPHYIPKYYHATNFLANEDHVALLTTKVFGRFSETLWEQSHKSVHLPIMVNELTSLCHSLLSSHFASVLHTEAGAHIDFSAHLNNVVATYTEQQAFTLPDGKIKIWDWKLSWDNVIVWNSNEA